MQQPLVAISTDVRQFDNYTWHAVPQQYLEAALSGAGVFPVLVPSFGDRLDFDELLSSVDGVMITGSKSNVHPSLYGGDASEANGPYDPARDATTLPLIRKAVERGVPLLAICRGIQVLNVARGGDLVQHLPDVIDSDRHKHAPGTFADHDVELRAGSRLATLLGERAPVKSHHHQAYGRLGEGLREAAWDVEDGTVEAVEDPRARFAIGVLWHPEEGEDFSLFAQLVDEARAYAEERGGPTAAPIDDRLSGCAGGTGG